MASKKSNPDDLLAQLDDLSTQQKPRATRPNTARAPRSTHGNTSQNEQDLLAELGILAQRPSSRPGTPSLRANQRSAAGNHSPKRTSTATPPLGAPSRTSEDKAPSDRKSADSTRSSHQAFTPATTAAEDSPAEQETSTPGPSASQHQQEPQSGGGWGGWFSNLATSAVTQAQAQVKNLQQQTQERGLPIPAAGLDAQKWTEQLKGNVGLLRSYGLSGETIGNLRSMAMPTFQNILQTIAPPISSHERLIIYITHDLVEYPSLQPTIYRVFERVMSQVEGGDLMVVQKGEESGPKRSSRELGMSKIGVTSLNGAWSDGPWWRTSQESQRRSTNAVRGTGEGTKLARASAEGYASEFFAAKGGLEEVAKRAAETLSDSNPTRDSQIFLAIHAIVRPSDMALGASDDNEKEAQEPADEFLFVIHLHDPIHGIAFNAISQAVPMQWVDWLDAPNDVEGALPESIREIIDGGGVDPREWISEWMEETLSLAAGVVAQRYVARRMGVGESGSKGKGRLKADMNTAQMVESGGGEAARAL